MAHTNALMGAWVDLQAFFKRWSLSREEIVKILEIPDEVYESWVLSGAMGLNQRIIARCKECLILHETLCKVIHEDQVPTWIKGALNAPPCSGRSPIQTICDEIEKDPRIIQHIIAYVRHHNH